MRALTDATAALLKPIKLRSYDRLHLQIDEKDSQFHACVKTSTPGTLPSFAAQRDWISRVPEKKKLDYTNEWNVAATDYTAEIINATWPPEQIVWGDAKSEMVFRKLLMTTQVQEVASLEYAAYKLTGEVPDGCAVELNKDESLKLAKYQQAASHCASRCEGYGFFMEQGTGKTPTAISEFCTAARDSEDLVKVLIVCPKNVRLNWQREIEKFATQPGKSTILRGGKLKRAGKMIAGLARGPNEQHHKFAACIISYESATRTMEYLTMIEWDYVYLDEAHMIKRPETQRTKAMMLLREAAKKRRVLTGTPVSNSPLDLYALFEFMGKGWSGFRTWQEFKEFYGVFEEIGDGISKLVAIQNKPFMQERLSRTSFIISKREAMPELPEKVYDVAEVEMTGQQQEAYVALAEKLLFEIESDLADSDNKAITVNNILTKLLRLAQVCSGFACYDKVLDPTSLEVLQSGSTEFFSPDPKLEWLVEMLKEKGPKEKTIVWSCFVPCIKTIHERLMLEGIEHVVLYGATSEADREIAMHKFNTDPKCKVFLGNPAAGGVGVNLPGSDVSKWDTPEDDGCNADHVVHYAMDWSYVKRAQCEDRNHGRNRCRTNVRHTDLVVPETVDEDIRLRVLKKKKMALEISDIREILTSILTGLKGSESDDE